MTVQPEQPQAADPAADPAVDPSAPPRPERPPPVPLDTRLGRLIDNVRDALLALPGYFDSKTYIEGLEAGDLFALNTVLGGTIEVQVVDTLNRIRKVWDPDDEWTEHSFERSSQSFPDVRLVARSGTTTTPALGIELKGWYLLAKEGEPSFRYKVSPAACAEHDLLVVVPWHLKSVLSGTPIVYPPYIENARYAAELRNYYWEHGRSFRGEKANSGIRHPDPLPTPYAPPRARISDEAVSDSGKNFGRAARVPGLMTDFVAEVLGKRVAGIDADNWRKFFKIYTDARDPEAVAASLIKELQRAGHAGDDARRITELLSELASRFPREPR